MIPSDDIILTDSDFDQACYNLEKALITANDSLQPYLKEVLSVTKDHYRHQDVRKFLSFFYQKNGLF